eukprot:Platyproteum_vivax@DN4751_c0_g1_i1.p1
MNASWRLVFKGQVFRFPSQPSLQDLRNAVVQLGAAGVCTFSGTSGSFSKLIRTDNDLRTFFNNCPQNEPPQISAVEEGSTSFSIDPLLRSLLAQPEMPACEVQMPEAPTYVIKGISGQVSYDTLEKLVTRVREHYTCNPQILSDLTYIIPAKDLPKAQEYFQTIGIDLNVHEEVFSQRSHYVMAIKETAKTLAIEGCVGAATRFIVLGLAVEAAEGTVLEVVSSFLLAPQIVGVIIVAGVAYAIVQGVKEYQRLSRDPKRPLVLQVNNFNHPPTSMAENEDGYVQLTMAHEDV